MKEKFIVKKGKNGLKKIIKPLIFEKKDTFIQNNENIFNNNFTLEYCLENQNLNYEKYKNLETKLIYTDNFENNIEEKLKLNKPVSLENLLHFLQNDKYYDCFINDKKSNKNLFLNYKNIKNKNNNINNDIIFDSNFEQGNLRFVIEIINNDKNYKEYDLILRKEINSFKNYSGFLFSIFCKKQMNIKFNIINLRKKNNLSFLNKDINILTYDNISKFTRNSVSNIYYYSNLFQIKNEKNEKETNSIKEENDLKYYYTLTFTYNCTLINNKIYFCNTYPYTYSMLQEFLKSLNKNVKFSLLQKTACGNFLDVVQISNFSLDNKNKKTVIFTSRIHSGETPGNFIIESIINNLINNTKYKFLLNKFIFKIIPMINIDGVINGNYRYNIFGKDLNRYWNEPDKNLYPELIALKNFFSVNKPIYFFCDFHGHAGISSCGVYSCDDINFFEKSKYYCKYNNEYLINKGKENTCRSIVYNEYKVKNSFCFETSLYSVYENNLEQKNIKGIKLLDFEEIGKDFLDSFIEFIKK